MTPAPSPSSPSRHRNVAIAGGVVAFHLAALWALQTGLLRRAVEVVVPVEVLSQIIPPAPKVEAPPAPPPPAPAPVPVPPRKVAAPRPAPPPPAPMPVARPDPAPAPTAPVGVATPQPPAPPIAAPVSPPATAPAPPAPAAGARVEAPMIDADYAPNEEAFRPPAISRRLGEYGTVVLKVTVGVDGFASRVDLVKSSGYERLDKAALAGARKLKFRPATRNGVPVEWTYDLPVKYAERTE